MVHGATSMGLLRIEDRVFIGCVVAEWARSENTTFLGPLLQFSEFRVQSRSYVIYASLLLIYRYVSREAVASRNMFTSSLVTATKVLRKPHSFITCSVLPHGWGKTGKVWSLIQASLRNKLQDLAKKLHWRSRNKCPKFHSVPVRALSYDYLSDGGRRFLTFPYCPTFPYIIWYKRRLT